MTIIKIENENLKYFIELIKLFEEVFEMKNFKIPSQDYLKDLIDKKDFHAFVVIDDGLVVGGLTVYTLHQYYSTKPLAYIFDLAVKKELQNKGIGKKLIEFTKSFFSSQGYEEVFVQADRVDNSAVEFYRKTKPSEEEDVFHFYYSL